MFAGIFCTFPLRHSVGFLVEWLYLLLDFIMVIFVHLWLSTVLMFYGKLSHDTFKKIYNFVVLVTCEVWRSRCLLPRKRASLEGSSRCHSLERTAFRLHFSTLHFAIITGHFHSALRWNISQHIEKSVFKKISSLFAIHHHCVKIRCSVTWASATLSPHFLPCLVFNCIYRGSMLQGSRGAGHLKVTCAPVRAVGPSEMSGSPCL